jgi:hypothetical protein
MGSDNGPKSVNRYAQVGVLQSTVYPDTMDSGMATATAAVVAATTVDQCFFDDGPRRKSWSRSCGFVSVICSALAFLSSTASVNQNFADAKTERADAKTERADARKDAALRFDLQQLQSELQSLQFQLQALRFDFEHLHRKHEFRYLSALLVETKNKRQEVQTMKPRVRQMEQPRFEDQPVDNDVISAQIRDIYSRIEEKDSKIIDKKRELKRCREEAEVAARGDVV